MLASRWAAIAVPFLLLGCAAQTSPRGDDLRRDVITEEQIDASQAANAYDVIKKLRANFLSHRGQTSLRGTSSPYPTVYVDDQAYGPIASLRNIPAIQVAEIRLYRAWEAQSKYGIGNMGGVIAVSTRH